MSDELGNFVIEDDDGGTTEYTAEALVDAHKGVYGPDAEIWADEVIDALSETEYFEENGVDLDQEFEEFEEPEEDFEAPPAGIPWEREFTAEMDIKVGRLEKQIGRALTEAELQAITNEVLPQGHVPDLVEAYGPQLAARDTDSPESRRELMVEEFEEQADRDGIFDQEPREPESEDEARRAYMTSELENAQAEDPVEA